MSRHRNVRTMNIDEEYDSYYGTYGHSVPEDDYCISPSTAEQFIYKRGDTSTHSMSQFMNQEQDIKEVEEEKEEEKPPQPAIHLNQIDKIKLKSCMMEMHNIVGETIPDSILEEAVIANDFDMEKALDSVLTLHSGHGLSSVTESDSKFTLPKPQREQRKGDIIANDQSLNLNPSFYQNISPSVRDSAAINSHPDVCSFSKTNDSVSILNSLLNAVATNSNHKVVHSSKKNDFSSLSNLLGVSNSDSNRTSISLSDMLEYSCFTSSKEADRNVSLSDLLNQTSSCHSNIASDLSHDNSVSHNRKTPQKCKDPFPERLRSAERSDDSGFKYKNLTSSGDETDVEIPPVLRRQSNINVAEKFNPDIHSLSGILKIHSLNSFTDEPDNSSPSLHSSHKLFLKALPSMFASTLCHQSVSPAKIIRPEFKRAKLNFLNVLSSKEISRFKFQTSSPDDVALERQKLAFGSEDLKEKGLSVGRRNKLEENASLQIGKQSNDTVDGGVRSNKTNDDVPGVIIASCDDADNEKSIKKNLTSLKVPVSGFDTCTTSSPRSQSSTPKSSRNNSRERTIDEPKSDDKSFRDSPATRVNDSLAQEKRLKTVMSDYRKERSSGKELINMVVIGHVDAGKSTLMGHLLYRLGCVNKKTMHKYEQESKKMGKASFAYAWVLDETQEERSRGITMDIAQSQFETDHKIVNLLDAPGHKDFIPNMITGAAQADVAILVVDATRGEFETGFESGGQTREHALLVRSLGVSQLAVAINKLDNVGWSQERFGEIVEKLRSFLKQVGFKDADVQYVPCSGLTGENITEAPKDCRFESWYRGPTLLRKIDTFTAPARPVSKPLRLTVADVFKGLGGGFCVSGLIETGSIRSGDKVVVMPTGDQAIVKGISVDDTGINQAFAGDHIIINVSGLDMNNVTAGNIVCHVSRPIRAANVIRARIVIFNISVPLTRGFPVVLHYKSLTEQATITKLLYILHKSSGEVIKKKPRCLTKNSNAEIEIRAYRPICIEVYKDFKELGRFMLRSGGSTIAAGLVTQILS